MSEEIRSYADSLFYMSAASTANVREQLIKLQQSSKLIRALSDASTVNTNGDKLQDILTGLSFGNSTQRHKWRAIYDTTNDRYLIQRNSGTDASKTWVERYRIDSSGNVTVSGTQATTGLITASGGIRMGGNLDMNQFYIRNLEKVNGRTRTDSLTVHGASTLQGAVTTSGALTVGTTLTVTGASTLTGGGTVEGASVFDYTYAEKSGGNQSISAGVSTNITELTGLNLPNTSSVNTRTYIVRFAVQVLETSASNNQFTVLLYNGANGNLSDTLVYRSVASMAGSLPQTLHGMKKFTPGASNRTKFGLAIQATGTLDVFGASPLFSTVECWEVTS